MGSHQLVASVCGSIKDDAATTLGPSHASMARGSDKLAARLNGKEIVKTVVVPGKLVNFVVR